MLLKLFTHTLRPLSVVPAKNINSQVKQIVFDFNITCFRKTMLRLKHLHQYRKNGACPILKILAGTSL